MIMIANDAQSKNIAYWIQKQKGEHVSFVTYSGKWPNLCRGVLILNIDGKDVSFGYDDDCDHIPFWMTDGSCGFKNNYKQSYINKDKWLINYNKIPDEYKKYANEIDRLFNAYVEYGCCGGCL